MIRQSGVLLSPLFLHRAASFSGIESSSVSSLEGIAGLPRSASTGALPDEWSNNAAGHQPRLARLFVDPFGRRHQRESWQAAELLAPAALGRGRLLGSEYSAARGSRPQAAVAGFAAGGAEPVLTRRGRWWRTGINSYLQVRLLSDAPASEPLHLGFLKRCDHLASCLASQVGDAAASITATRRGEPPQVRASRLGDFDAALIELKVTHLLACKLAAVWGQTRLPAATRLAVCAELLLTLAARRHNPLFLHAIAVVVRQAALASDVTEQLLERFWRSVCAEVPAAVPAQHLEGHCLGLYFSRLLRNKPNFFDVHPFAAFSMADKCAWKLLATQCTFLDLSVSNIDDVMLAEIFAHLDIDAMALDELNLEQTQVRGAALSPQHLPRTIRALNLTFCSGLEQSALMHLKEFAGLAHVDLYLCNHLHPEALAPLLEVEHLQQVVLPFLATRPPFLHELARRGVQLVDR